MKKQYFSLVEPWQSPKNELHKAALSEGDRFNRLIFETTPAAFLLSLRIAICKCNIDHSRCGPLTVTVSIDNLADEGWLKAWVGNRVANIAVVTIYEVKE